MLFPLMYCAYARLVTAIIIITIIIIIIIPYIYKAYCWAKTWQMHSERRASLGSMLSWSAAFHGRLFIGGLPQLWFDMEPFSEHERLRRGFAL